jgi:UDP-N-acetylmuramoyl-tripeptide--D-alanyl-D-alanine ligase
LVEDSLSALQELAKFHRRYLNLPIIALTGSNGKPTKEFISFFPKNIGQKQQWVISIIIGVPLTLLSFQKQK